MNWPLCKHHDKLLTLNSGVLDEALGLVHSHQGLHFLLRGEEIKYFLYVFRLSTVVMNKIDLEILNSLSSECHFEATEQAVLP